jgi:hypothetical protein
MSLKEIQLHEASQSLAVTLRERIAAAKRVEGKTLLLDISGSMNTADAEGGKRRLDLLAEIVQGLRPLPKNIVVFSADARAIFAPAEIPDRGETSTDLAGAFRYIKNCKLPPEVVLVTDGQPDSPEAALHEAIGLKVNSIYAGAEGKRPSFLDDLAKATGGSVEVASFGSASELRAAVTRGLLNGGK